MPWKRMVGAAALLVIGLVAGVYFLKDGDPRAPDQRAQLQAALAGLKERHAALFADFTLLSDAELALRDERTPLRMHEPRGAMLHPAQPAFRWQVPDGAGSCDVWVTDMEGAQLFEATTDKGGARWPASREPLDAGKRYVWHVRARLPGGDRQASMGFRVLGVPETKRYAQGSAAIHTEVDPLTAVLLTAHWAIRFDLYLEAHDLAGKADKRRVAHATRAWLNAKLGR